MARREYDMSGRRREEEASRARALAAAYQLLSDPECRDLSVDAVARAAGVTRATLYNQFGSRGELLVAVFRDVGRRMQAERIHFAINLPEPEQALSAMFRESTTAWARQYEVVRKIFALAALDAAVRGEVERAERERRRGVAHLAKRLVAARPSALSVREAAALLAALTSFQAFEALAMDAGPGLAGRRLLRLARAALGVPEMKGERV